MSDEQTELMGHFDDEEKWLSEIAAEYERRYLELAEYVIDTAKTFQPQ